jgi:ABC-2 type transport system ATP-binding protein/lipopolysaccharide transport system ATP-binding protein
MGASIRLEKVRVTFPIFDGATRSIKQQIIASATGGRIGVNAREKVHIRALDGIDLELDHGARVGLVGHNGAGKSTLLRVLGKIYEPESGSVDIVGSIAPLLDISTGMDGLSTGYENVVLRGLYLGLSRKEIRSRMDEIAEFSELGSFLDLPLHTYSAGMHARLAFSVSTCIEPEILLLDESIGTSDAAFMAKARARLTRLVDQASIVVVASHRESLLKDLCEHLIFMEHGKIVTKGTVDEVVRMMREKNHPLR